MDKKKESKATPSNAEPDTGQNGNRVNPQNQQQTTVTGVARKFSKTESPRQDNNVASSNPQHPPISQCPHTSQAMIEQSSPAILRNPVGFHHPPSLFRRTPLYLNQHLHQNPYQQQQKNPMTSVQSQNGPFWFPRPEISAAGASYQPFTHHGATDSSWHPPMVMGASSSNDPVSTLPYQRGYSYPMGFPAGHWDPWGQTHNQFPYSYPYPPFSSGYGFFSGSPSAADGSVMGRLHQRGIVRTPEKLSQKHQRLWEAQSAENIHLWATLSRVETEMASCRTRLTRLESRFTCPKPQPEATVELSSVAAANLAAQTSKRGRPKRPATSASPEDSQPKSRGKKPISITIKDETKEMGSEKEKVNQLEDKGKSCIAPVNSIGSTGIPKQTDGRSSTIFGNSGGFEFNGSNLKPSTDSRTTPTFQNQFRQENPGKQISAFGLKSTSEIKEGDQRTAFPVLSPKGKGLDTSEGMFASYAGTSSGMRGWHSSVLSEDRSGNVLGVGAHGFYSNGRGNKANSGWCFVDENVSEENEDDDGGLGKDADNGDMEENTNSAADRAKRTKADHGAFGSDSSAAIPKVSPRISRR